MIRQKFTGLNKSSRESGVSLIELLTGTALVGFLAVFLGKSLNLTEEMFFGVTARNARSDFVTLLSTAIQKDFYNRTQIDIFTGVGVYQGVTFDPSTDVTKFSITKRSKADLTKFVDVSYQTLCEPYSSITLPELPEDFCTSTPSNGISAGRRYSCPSGQRMYVFRNSPNGVLRLPAAKAGTGYDVISAGFCVINADNESINIRLATAIRNVDTAIWKVQSLSVGEDMGRNGIEFVDL